MGETTITCSGETHKRLSELKPYGATWDGFLNTLADTYEEHDATV